MAAGIQISKAEINQGAGSVARAVFNVVATVRQFKFWLDSVSANDLETVYGFTSAEAADIKSAFNDLEALANVFEGTGTRPVAYDHRAFTRRLIGTGLY